MTESATTDHLGAARPAARGAEWLQGPYGVWLFIPPWVLAFSGLVAAAWNAWLVGIGLVVCYWWAFAQQSPEPTPVTQSQDMAHSSGWKNIGPQTAPSSPRRQPAGPTHHTVDPAGRVSTIKAEAAAHGCLAAEALTEPRGGSDFFGTTTTAVNHGDHFVL